MVVLDWDNQKTSNEVLFDLRSSWSEIPVILTCFPDLQDYQLFSSLGVSNVILKPFDHRDVRSVFEHVLPSFDDETTSAPAIELDHGHSFIRASKEMRRIEAQAALVARSDIPILILGESGVGKEILALFTHKMSLRSNRTFMKINCAAMPAELLESELFGYEQGAFTGAVKMKPGKFEMCNDGTIFLDEIGELSLYTQVKLLRVLQQREFSRLGSNRLIPLRARFIFATHQDLSEMVAQGKFRQDLYYRINVMRIEAPPLQDHPEDIPQIAMHFLNHYAHMYQKQLTEFEPEAMAMLQSYAWPGNVRELENILQRAIILARGETIRAEDLPSNLREENVVDIADFHPAGSFERKLRDYKVKLAEAAVRENHGNKTLAARSLCISRAYLHRLIRLAEPDQIFEEEGQEIGTA